MNPLKHLLTSAFYREGNAYYQSLLALLITKTSSHLTVKLRTNGMTRYITCTAQYNN